MATVHRRKLAGGGNFQLFTKSGKAASTKSDKATKSSNAALGSKRTTLPSCLLPAPMFRPHLIHVRLQLPHPVGSLYKWLICVLCIVMVMGCSILNLTSFMRTQNGCSLIGQ